MLKFWTVLKQQKLKLIIMKIVSKWGANYLVCKPEEYRPKKETLYFGETKIDPGTLINKIGEKERTSFEMEEYNFLEYEGTFYLDNIKYCAFNSDVIVKSSFIYRYVFAMEENTVKPNFLLLFNKTGQACRDIDSTKVVLFDGEKRKLILHLHNKTSELKIYQSKKSYTVSYNLGTIVAGYDIETSYNELIKKVKQDLKHDLKNIDKANIGSKKNIIFLLKKLELENQLSFF